MPRDEVRSIIPGSQYVSALYDPNCGHLHPLNYTLGLARAAAAAGVTIHENSVALKLDRTNGIRVETTKGSVRARRAVLAGDALLTGLEPAVNSRIMPVGNYIVATEPLPDAGAIPLRRARLVASIPTAMCTRGSPTRK